MLTRSRSPRRLTALALVALLPVVSFAVISLASELPQFFNPCFTWGMANGGTVEVSAAGPCTSSGGSSETIPQAIMRLALIQGGIILASLFGVAGIIRSGRNLILPAAIILFLESAPFVFDGLFVLTIPPAALFLRSYSRMSSDAGVGKSLVSNV